MDMDKLRNETPMDCDLDTEEGRRQFENKVNKAIEEMPGFFVVEGESFDFDAYYARRAIRLNQDTSKYSAELVEQLRAEVAEEKELKDHLYVPVTEDDPLVGKNTIGTAMSEKLAPESRKTFMSMN